MEGATERIVREASDGSDSTQQDSGREVRAPEDRAPRASVVETVALGTVALELRICPAPFSPLEALARWQEGLSQRAGGAPAAESHFIGRVRGRTAAGAALEALELEHYPGMTEASLLALAREGAARHGVAAVLVLHRVGRLAPGEPIVLVAVAADRRGPALRCGQELLEALKHDAPFWKREWSGGTGTWVAGNTPLEDGAQAEAITP